MIFVTGANGFLGRHVVRNLQEQGPVKALLSRPDSGFSESFPAVGTVCGDLLDEALLQRALADAETIVHLASKNVDRDGSGFERVNGVGTRRLCRLAVAAGVGRLIYVSSVGVYGHGRHRDVDETTPLRPDTPFSRSKAAAENLVLERHRAGELRATILRHRFVYGEGDESVIPRLIRAARKYRFWISGGRAKMSLVWAPDFARVVRHAACGSLDADDPIYHVTDGEPIAYRDVVTTLCRAFGLSVPRASVPFRLLYTPLVLRERLFGIDPEAAASSLTSLRLKLVAQDNTFSRRKLESWLPDLRCVRFAEGFERSLDFYSRFS